MADPAAGAPAELPLPTLTGRAATDPPSADSVGGACLPGPQRAPEATAAPGSPQVPGMTVYDLVGRGSQATVYRARRTGGDGAEYVVKVFTRPPRGGADAEVPLRREAALLAAIDHPGLPRVHEVGDVNGRPYLVMDLVHGQPLNTVLAGGALGLDRFLPLAVDLAETLAHVHRRGLVHRDIKPSNIMIDAVGQATLIDFGMAARGVRDAGEDVVVGTLAYTSPEQAKTIKVPVDHRSDLYSLGVTFFECLAGRLPFEAEELGELLRMHATAVPADLRVLAPQVPEELVGIVERLLAKDPDDRYSSAESLRADLLALLPPEGRPHPLGVDDGPGLCGREDELRQLGQFCADVAEGRGAACLVRGPAGSGKTSLVAELGRRFAVSGHAVAHGKASVDDAAPLAPVRQAIEGLLGAWGELPPDRAERNLNVLRAAAGTAAGLLSTLSPSLAAALGVDEPPERQWQDQLPGIVADFLVRLAGGLDGLLLHLDDLQWLDLGTRRVLTMLAPQLATTALVVLCTARSEPAVAAEVATAVTAFGDNLDVDLLLGPLDEAGIRALVAGELPGLRAEASLVRALVTRGNGNALVTLEYLRAMLDAGLLRPSWGSWLLDEDALIALELPEDVLGVILARVEGLGAHTRRILTVAAALGAVFRTDLLVAVSDDDPAVVLNCLAEATGHRLVEARAERRHAFLHDRIREAMLRGLTGSQLRSLHQHIADVLDTVAERDAELIYAAASHAMRGEPRRRPERTFAACLAAGTLALEAQSPTRAVDFLAAAADLGRPLDAAFLLTYGTALQRAGRLAEAAQRLEEAIGLAGDALQRAEILAQLAVVHRAGWNADAARDAVRRGLREAGAPLPSNPVLLVLSTLGSALVGWLLGVTGAGCGRLRGRQLRRAELVARFHDYGGYVGTISLRPDVLVLHNLRSIYWVNRLGRGRQFAITTIGLGFLAGLLGLWPVAERSFRRGERAAADLRDPELPAMAAFFRGITAYLAGRDDGEQLAQAITEHGHWLDTGMFTDGIGALCVEAGLRGDDAEALDWLRRGNRRISTVDGGPITALVLMNVFEGRFRTDPAALAELIRGTRERVRDHGKGVRVNVTLLELYSLMEARDYGERLEEVVRELDSYRLHPATAIRPHRIGFVHVARIRLEQCRLASADQRPIRLRQAKVAAARLDKMANTDLLRGWARLASAGIALEEGSPRRCLATLGGVMPGTSDAPALAFDVARMRARAFVDLGRLGEAGRQAQYAERLAQSEGWGHRALWIRQEFSHYLPAAATMTSTRLDSVTIGDHLARQRLNALQEVSRAVARVLDPEAVVRITLDETIRILNAERAFLFLTAASVDGHGETLVAHLGRSAAGEDLREFSGYSHGLVERVHREGRPLVVTGTEEGQSLGAQSVAVHGLRSILIGPLALDGRLLGVVYLDSQVAKGIFTADDAGVLTALTTYIAMALETARAAQLEVTARTEQRNRELAESLQQAIAVMSATLDPEQVLTRLLDQVARILGTSAVRLLTRAGNDFTVHAPLPSGAAAQDRPAARQLAGTSDLAELWDSEHLVLGVEQLPPPLWPDAAPDGCVVAVPLVHGAERRGLLVLACSPVSDERDGQLRLVSTLATQAMTAHDRAVLFGRISAFADEDQLTGITNRRRFFEVGERDFVRAVQGGLRLAALMVDIDHFKSVNDTYGHAVGDEVIRGVAERLSRAIRPNDMIGRYGGEEFAMLIHDTDAQVAATIAERARTSVSDSPVPTRSGPLAVTVSVGLAELRPGDQQLTDLLHRADQGLYRAKENGRNQVGLT